MTKCNKRYYIYVFSRRFYPNWLTFIIQAIHIFPVCVFSGNWTHNLLRCKRNTLPLSHRNIILWYTTLQYPICVQNFHKLVFPLNTMLSIHYILNIYKICNLHISRILCWDSMLLKMCNDGSRLANYYSRDSPIIGQIFIISNIS